MARFKEHRKEFPPFGVLYLAAVIEQAGHNVAVKKVTQDAVSQSPVPTLNFLAREDVALKAYFESRVRYLGSLSPRCAFNQIGEVLPTIMRRGQVIGTWAWDVSKMAVTYSIIRGYGSLELSKEVRRQVKTLSGTLRLRWV